MEDKLYEEFKVFYNSKECDDIPMSGIYCRGCKFDEVCSKLEDRMLEENRSNSTKESSYRVVCIPQKEYDRLKEIEFMYNDLCK